MFFLLGVEGLLFCNRHRLDGRAVQNISLFPSRVCGSDRSKPPKPAAPHVNVEGNLHEAALTRLHVKGGLNQQNLGETGGKTEPPNPIDSTV
ncbi:MAG: hypothetical protein ACTSWP_01720 [Candidatus Freyarchaeota archaeon]